jgi:hypothetical protein
VLMSSEWEQDPSANTGRFRAFVERGDEEPASRRSAASPAMLVVAGVIAVVVIAIVIAAFA